MSTDSLHIFDDRDEILARMEKEFHHLALNMRLREVKSSPEDSLTLVTDSFKFVAAYGGMIRQLIDEEIERRKHIDA